MAKPSNGKIERYYLEQFVKFYQLPGGDVAYADKPDVIVRGVRKIGIEITNFFLQSGSCPASEQRQRPLRDTVVAESHRLYMAGGGKRIGLTFGFDKKNPIKSSRKRTLAAELAAFALSVDNPRSGAILNYRFRATPEVSSIYCNAGEYSNAKWRVVQVHSFGLTCRADLEAIVREKEAKAAEYEACDGYWLLIVVDGIDAAQEQEVRIDDPYIHSDIFEKIIIFHTFGHVVEVKSTSASTAL